MRAFVAICLSNLMKASLQDCIGQLRAQCVSGRFSRVENLHLTLAFIGETNRVDQIRAAIDQTASAPFSLALSGTGQFGDLWWVGVRQGRALADLAANLQEALRAYGFPIEHRAFRPHITIARQVVTNQPVRLCVPPAEMTVGRVSLMRSDRVGGKLTYTEVYGKILT